MKAFILALMLSTVSVSASLFLAESAQAKPEAKGVDADHPTKPELPTK
jgi:hypothetical protein